MSCRVVARVRRARGEHQSHAARNRRDEVLLRLLAADPHLTVAELARRTGYCRQHIHERLGPLKAMLADTPA